MSDFFSALKGEPGYTYGDILPYRYKSSAPGTPREKGTPIEFALPTAAREAIGALAHAINTPREALLGHLAGPDLDRAGAMMGPELLMGGAMVPAPGGASAMRVFGGPLARTADKAALGKAFTLESRLKAAKYSPEAIRDAVHKETGWFRGADGKWRFEIPDSGAQIDAPHMKKELNFEGPDGAPIGNLQDYLHHPELFAAYPDLGKVKLEGIFDRGSLGYYNHYWNRMGLSPRQSDPSLLSSILHEAQHGIQARENFSYGGNAGQFLPDNWADKYEHGLGHYEYMNDELRAKGFEPHKINTTLKAIQQNEPIQPSWAHDYNKLLSDHPELFDRWFNARNNMAGLHSQKQAAWEMYNGLAGEVEARLAQARHKEAHEAGFGMPTAPGSHLPQAYYENVPPWKSDAWIPYEDQIVQLFDEPGRAK